MKYKIGDKVKIKSLDWYNKNKDNDGHIECGKFTFIKDMREYCGQIATITEISSVFNNKYYHLNIDDRGWTWTDDMFEELVEEEINLKFKIGDRVITNKGHVGKFEGWISDYQVRVLFKESGDNVVIHPKNLKLVEEETKPKDMGEVSDGYHTFNELYEYRMLYNVALFNEFAKQGLYDVHKSRKHSDGEYPFGDSNWFIVMAELPTGQISNHYEMKDWDKFQIPEKPLANKWDKHTPQDVAKRIREFLTPKPKYPKTYEECCKIIGISRHDIEIDLPQPYQQNMSNFFKLIICRDAYWKLYGEEMGLGKPWEPTNDNYSYIITRHCNEITTYRTTGNSVVFEFPTPEMRDDFKENFDKDLEFCKELL